MTKAKSAQPQLPPRPQRTEDGNGNKTHYHADAVDSYITALEAENESLKAQIEERNNRGTGYLYVPKAQYDALKAKRDKALEVIREYRNSLSHRHRDDWSSRCPTCIKADALLSRETNEVTR